jgi:nudix motif 8
MMMAFSLVARRCATRTAAALSRRHATIKYSERGLGYHLSRNFSTSLIPDDHNHHDDDDDESRRRPSSKRRSSTTIRRVWKATDEESSTTTRQEHRPDLWDYWEDPVLSKSEMLQAASNNNNDDSSSSSSKLDELLSTISSQEKRGGRMKQSQLGVLREDPSEDMRLLVENYTVPALASALRDREDVLQQCAQLLQKGDLDQLSVLLQPYQREYVLQRRITEETTLDLSEHGLTSTPLEQLRKALHRMPRRVTQAHQKRAGVVVALCNVDGVPSVLLEKRSKHLRAHPDEVCLPGGMVCSASDPTIVATCLREMGEEIEGLPEESIRVLGILRCNWGEVHHLVGVAVTPLVAFVGELGERVLRPNPSEVSQVFTIPLEEFMDRSLWIHREGLAPIFTGGPHPIWGLTGYILERFVKDILARYDIIWPKIE